MNKPITQYTRRDIRQHSRTYKGCENGCSIFCVYRNSHVDNAPFSVAKAIYEALRRGALFRGRHKNIAVPDDISIPRQMAAEVESV